ncbi:MAG TPA: hypothetical protein PLQ76_05615, partial [bacterium]|nr:hypothetical protein [bacterium]
PDHSMLMAASFIAGSRQGGEALLSAMKISGDNISASFPFKVAEDVNKFKSSNETDEREMLDSLKIDLRALAENIRSIPKVSEDETFIQYISPRLDKAVANIETALKEIEAFPSKYDKAALTTKLNSILRTGK